MPSYLKTLPSRFEVDREKATRSLASFITQGWHVIEPATPYIHGWHIDAISELLMALWRLEIRNAYVNIPPRHMKSRLTGVFFPAWVWTHAPHTRWLTSSYADALAIRDTLAMRRLITSPWYRERWGDKFTLTSDQNQKTRFDNDKSGYRIAHGIGGGATGEGGDFILTDDPLKALDAESDAALDNVQEWWSGTMSTRGNDPKTVRKLIIMQRLATKDLTGYVERKMREGGTQYEGLILPAEYEPNRMTVAPDCKWRDRRTEPGELLWPERFGRAELDALKIELGSESAVAGQLQQRPTPAGGAIYRDTWWQDGRNRYDAQYALHGAVATYLSVDTALKDKDDSDYTAISIFALMPDYRVRLVKVYKERLLFPALVTRIHEVAIEADCRNVQTNEGLLRGIIIEDKGSGTSAIQTLVHAATGIFTGLIVPFMPHGDKQYRARQASVWCERDCVELPLPSDAVPWLLDFTYDLFNFPRAEHDDTVDTFTQFILYAEHIIAEGWRARTFPFDPESEPDEFSDNAEW